MIEMNAMIKSAKIHIEDHGLLTFNLDLELQNGFNQGFGGYSLYSPYCDYDYGGMFINEVLRVAGISKWDGLPGRTIRVRKKDKWDTIHSVGHIIRDEWFTPSERMK